MPTTSKCKGSSIGRATRIIASSNNRAPTLEVIIQRTSDANWPRGCLNTNSWLECPNSGDEISRNIAERLGAQGSAIYWVLRRA